MTDQDIRLECLRLAVGSSTVLANTNSTPDAVIAVAEKMFNFVRAKSTSDNKSETTS